MEQKDISKLSSEEREEIKKALRNALEIYEKGDPNVKKEVLRILLQSIYLATNDYTEDLEIRAEGTTDKAGCDLYPCLLTERYRADDKTIMEAEKTGEEKEGCTARGPREEENGDNIGVLDILRDIAERKRTEEELKRVYNTLKEAQLQFIQSERMASVGELAAGITHEANNPLSYVKLKCY